MPPDPSSYDILIAARQIPDGLIVKMTNLKWIQLLGVGYDQVYKWKIPTNREFLFTNAGTATARTVAEFVIMGILALYKELPVILEQQKQHSWALPVDMRRLAGKTIGIVGLGNIGSEVAKRAKAFDLKVIGFSRKPVQSPFLDENLSLNALQDKTPFLDILVPMVPGNPESHNLISRDIISRLPREAILINVARSTVVDLDAVIEALKDNRLRGALFDTFDIEPLPADSPIWTVQNLIVTPHCAYQYENHVPDVIDLIVDNFRRYVAGEKLSNICPVII